MSGSLAREKDEQFASELGLGDFKANTEWLGGFKDQNNIAFKAVSGESGCKSKS